MRRGMIRLRTFPRNRLIEVPVGRLRTSELSLYQSLGDPTGMTDPIDPDPRLYWDLEWACGLVMALQFHQLTEVLEVSLDQADVQHALRHLGVEAYDLRLLRIEDPQQFDRVARPLDLSWDLWRAAPDGSDQHYKRGLTQRDAECWADEAEELTGRRHWVAPGAGGI
jgi:hypothetical protein